MYRVRVGETDNIKNKIISKNIIDIVDRKRLKSALDGLETSLLQSLSVADPATILQNFALIEQLETTKRTAQEISE